ncbi:MAG: SurA N-terminal domain-containing protein, partial [Balneolaceae bacterium]|nr:SurA N-terminal domain-containing protein [Balneolaceae bacterium]
MRKNTGIILWVLIFSFGVLWILADTQVFDALQAGPRSLGSVNGEPISLEEYNSRISGYIDRYSQQTGNSITPEMRAYYEDQAWNELVTSKLLQQKMDELGIAVTDQEVVEMITGENPDPFIRQQFQREDGTIDRVALQAAIEAPENSQIWVMIEQQL